MVLREIKQILSLCFIFLNNLPMCKRKRRNQNSSIKLLKRATTPIERKLRQRKINLLLGLEGTLVYTSVKRFQKGEFKEVDVKYNIYLIFRYASGTT